MKVLVVDDDLVLADVVSFTLRRAGFDVIMAHNGQQALERWENESPDLIVLDLNLPKLDGLTVCRRIRAQADTTPIIILSVRSEEDDVVEGLKLGADDYVVKPFSPRQLVARAEALIRRASGAAPPSVTPSILTFGDLTLDLARSEIGWSGQTPIHLTRLECRLSEILLRNGNQVLLPDTLIDYVWGPEGGDRIMLKQLVYRLRRKIEPYPTNPAHLQTAGNGGYTLTL